MKLLLQILLGPSAPAAPPAPVPPASSNLPTGEDAAAPAPATEEILAEAGDLLDALDAFEKGGEG